MKQFSKKNKKNSKCKKLNKKNTKKIKRNSINKMRGAGNKPSEPIINVELQTLITAATTNSNSDKIVIIENIIAEIIRIRQKVENLRDQFCKIIAWTVPSLKIIKYIKNIVGDKQILEIGSGQGLWAALLKIIGCNIIATDIAEYPAYYTDVEKINHINALKKYTSAKVLFLCFPSAGNSFAYESLKYFTENNIEKDEEKILIYIGQYKDGMNATDDFFNYLNTEWGAEGDDYYGVTNEEENEKILNFIKKEEEEDKNNTDDEKLDQFKDTSVNKEFNSEIFIYRYTQKLKSEELNI